MKRTVVVCRVWLGLLVVASLPSAMPAAELARFQIQEPLGRTWTDEWLTEEFDADFTNLPTRAGWLQLIGPSGRPVPAQFSLNRRYLNYNSALRQRLRLAVLFQATLAPNQTATFRVTDDGKAGSGWQGITLATNGSTILVNNGIYELEFDSAQPLPINAMRSGGVKGSLGVFRWPAHVQATNVTDLWQERGPARVILRREFQFRDSAHYLNLRLDIRAGDPWLGVLDSYNFGLGSAMTLDLRALDARVVYHPHAYSARTFEADPAPEDTTLQPPQHPIATLGPLWRDRWYGGGPFAFLYRPDADHGLGIAAVQPSGWNCRIDVDIESQCFEIHGDRERAGQVFVKLPTDGAHRTWALVFGPPETRHQLSRLTSARADIPLDQVRKKWVLDWPSSAAEFKAEAADVYLDTHFNQPSLSPINLPPQVKRAVEAASAAGQVKSRGLAVLAYLFTDPNYWPGPGKRWNVGPPHRHTEMYSVPLRIGLLMKDHPHARNWVQHGLRETYQNLTRDSFPGGAWSESPGCARSFFDVARNVKLLRDHGITNGFQAWPRLKEVATYLAALHTPEDPRYGRRQIAPIGDTGPGDFLQELRALAENFRGIDDRFADQLARFPEKGENAFDLGSREFPGFGAMLRGNPYDARHESFVTVKAGPARHQFHRDELAFHFCGLGTPLAIDHACPELPGVGGAGLHNRPDLNGKTPAAVAEPRAFKTSAVADLFVADERATNVHLVPLEPPRGQKPGTPHPTAPLPPGSAWRMRRFVLLVKHDPVNSRIPDYLVVRDEILSPEPVGWNLHVLARDLQTNGAAFRFGGQLDVDLAAHVLSPAVNAVEPREWGWGGPADARRQLTGAASEREAFGRVLPADFKRGTWRPEDGERTRWLRVTGGAGATSWFVVLMPNRRDQAAPAVEKLSAASARIVLGEETEVVHLGTDGRFQAAVERGERRVVLLDQGTLKPVPETAFAGAPAAGSNPP